MASGTAIRALIAALLIGAALVSIGVSSHQIARRHGSEDFAATVRARLASPAADAPSLGRENAAVTFVEFADFQSDDCGRAAPMARNLIRMYPDRARFEFRQFPSSQHPDAYLAAEASLAANAQGMFWEFHDVLFANPHDLSREALERYAAEVGLDVNAFRHALDTRQFADDVNADVALGRHMRVREVPSVFVNGEPVSVPYGVAELTQLVQSAAPQPR